MASGDATFQHIAIWTLLQLLESGDSKLIATINESTDVMKSVREISEKQVESGDEAEDGEDGGEAEVVALAQRCLEISSGETPSGESAKSDGNNTNNTTSSKG